jgi:type I restriction enzyme, S subunit
MSAAVRAGYKQTEVGVIPEDWEVTSLGQLSEFITSGSRGWASYYSQRGALFVRSQNVRDGQLDFTDRQFVNPPQGSEGNRSRLNRGDLLITITGNSVGNIALVEQELGEAYISQHVGLVRFSDPSRGSYICRFLAPGSVGNEQIFASQSGQSKPGLSLKNLQEFLVALPLPPEQHSIAATLTDVDALLAKLDALIDKKRDLKVAAMQQLLTGQTRLPGFSEVWEVKRLGDVSPLQRGFDLLTSRLCPGSYPVVYSNGVSSYHDEFMVKGPGVVTGRSGTIGNVHFVEGDFWPHNTSLWVTSFKGNSPKFIFYLLTSLGLNRFGTGSGVPTLNRNDVHAHSVFIPPTAQEQTAIAVVLSDMDTELTALEARRDKTRAIKQGMMQELLTGRIRLV